jgi:hypothetical protein
VWRRPAIHEPEQSSGHEPAKAPALNQRSTWPTLQPLMRALTSRQSLPLLSIARLRHCRLIRQSIRVTSKARGAWAQTRAAPPLNHVLKNQTRAGGRPGSCHFASKLLDALLRSNVRAVAEAGRRSHRWPRSRGSLQSPDTRPPEPGKQLFPLLSGHSPHAASIGSRGL